MSCMSNQPTFEVATTTIEPGTQVNVAGESKPLYRGKLKIGQNFIQLAAESGFKIEKKVAIINIVPSIDTPVCEVQSHILGESKRIDPRIERLTISRDLPMAQQRFAKEVIK